MNDVKLSCFTMIKFTIIVSVFILITGNVAQDFVKTFDSMVETEMKKIMQSGKYDDAAFERMRTNDMRSTMEFEDIIDYYNYTWEKHSVVTVDGYELTLFRIVKNKINFIFKKRPAVLLQHGIFSSSFDWVIPGPNRSLAFILVDRGFDVWLGNNRGCKYSRMHKTLDTDDLKYWDFSWHELGVYDLPAMIDYILVKTENKKVTYVGYSQGTTTSYVLLSERPEYNEKLSALFSLAPVCFCKNINPILRFMAKSTKAIHKFLNFMQMHEFKPIDENLTKLIGTFCFANAVRYQFCKNVIFAVVGQSEPQFDPDLFLIGLKHFPAGASTKQLAHYGQIISSGRFRQFDYGSTLNQKRYNSVEPPDYKIENIKVPTALFYAKNDLLTAPVDVKQFYEKLPKPSGLYKIPHRTFNHIDFLIGKDVKDLVYDKLVSLILKYQN